MVWTLRFGSLTQASNSERAIRTRPQAMYNQKRMIVVFHDRINGIAGQAIPAGKSL